ncbi:MAG: archaetidylserine decarboxylase, partial [Terriglobales bacterium]
MQIAEASVPAQGFATLQNFFTRGLRPDARPLDARPAALLSPADGCIGACGRIASDSLFQAKGRDYSLAALLQGPGERFHGGVFATVYLAPGDYHRFHAPVNGSVDGVRRVPGSFHSVNPATVARVPNVFVRNER